SPSTTISGESFTVTFTFLTSVQAFSSETVTKYSVVCPGATVTEAVFSPVLQIKCEPPEAVRTTSSPLQTVVSELTMTSILFITYTVFTTVDEQPLLPVTIRVY